MILFEEDPRAARQTMGDGLADRSAGTGPLRRFDPAAGIPLGPNTGRDVLDQSEMPSSSCIGSMITDRRVTQIPLRFSIFDSLKIPVCAEARCGSQAFHDDSDKTAAQRIAASHRVRYRHFESGARNPRPFCHRIAL
jgi:hypothetical protein